MLATTMFQATPLTDSLFFQAIRRSMP